MDFDKIRPINEKVLVKREIENDFTKGGIYLPDSAKKKINFGIVIAVGEGQSLENGLTIPMPVKEGDRIIFRLHGGHDLVIDDIKHVMLKVDEIVGVVEEGDFTTID